jgi:hypothetical protein
MGGAEFHRFLLADFELAVSFFRPVHHPCMD